MKYKLLFIGAIISFGFAIGLFISSTSIKLITEENDDLALVCALHQGNPYDVPDCKKLLEEISEKNIPKQGFIIAGIVSIFLSVLLTITGLIKNKEYLKEVTK